jgi:hypothetical protein
VPEGSKSSRLKSFSALDEDSNFLKLPKVDGAEYLVSLLYEAGLCGSVGMGVVPLTWNEIESWHRFTSLDLSIWERLLIKSLSEEYASELSRASAKDHPAPYIHVDEIEINRQAVDSKIRNVFAALKRTPNKPSEQLNKD